MAVPLHFLLLLLLLFSIFRLHLIVNASPPQSSYLSNSLLVPVTKHASSLQYLTRFHHAGIGTGGLVPTDLVVDLGGPFLWMDCGSSSSGRLVSSGSIQCVAAKPTMVGHDHGSKDFLKSCNLFTENRIAQVGSQGDLVQDVLAIRSTDDDVSVTSVSHNFLFTCAPKSLLSGLANGAQGMLGLGRHRISLPSQISSAFDSKWQFSLCLSSSNGVLSFGNQPQSSYLGPELSESLIYTPLLTTQSHHEYFINLQSIKINDKTLSLDKSLLSLNEEGLGGTKLSTIVPYTVMESSIYAIFYKAYEKAAMAMNMTKVPNVSPFGLCFSSKAIHETVVGPEVPAIDLVLQSKMVKWRIYGRNSMVQVSNEVMCLGFLDGGLNLKSSITLGGHQLEDVLLHFDLGTSMLGFSPSLLLKQRSCSDLKFDFMPKQSLLAKKEKDFLFPS